MFRPMAFSFMFALIGSMILSLTLMPVLASLFLARRATQKDTILIRWPGPVTPPCCAGAGSALDPGGGGRADLRRGLWIASDFGSEFMPKLDEGAIALQAWRLPSVALEKSIESTTNLERVLMTFPEVESRSSPRPAGRRSPPTRWGWRSATSS